MNLFAPRDNYGEHDIDRLARGFWEVLMGMRPPFQLRFGPANSWIVLPWWVQ